MHTCTMLYFNSQIAGKSRRPHLQLHSIQLKFSFKKQDTLWPHGCIVYSFVRMTFEGSNSIGKFCGHFVHVEVEYANGGG